MNIPKVGFEPIDPSFYPSDLKLPRIQKRIGDVLLKGSKTPMQDAEKSWALSFLRAPKSINAANPSSNHVSSITLTHQQFAPGSDPFSKSASVRPTDEQSTIPSALVFRSVGYKSSALPGLADLGVEFDARLGIIPNDPFGRVVATSGGPGPLAAAHIAGLYCAGWVKRGPTGVIASTMEDAFASADVIVQDWTNDVPFLNSGRGENQSSGLGWDALKDEVMAKGVRPLSWKDWKVIDEAECARGKEVGKLREKFGSVEEMLKVLDS
jgi:adrenodoxin-NADP+ reductase